MARARMHGKGGCAIKRVADRAWLPTRPPFGIGGACSGGYGLPALGCGCSSGVEHDLAKVGVEGSNPFARSKFTCNPKGLGAAGDGTPIRPALGKQGGSSRLQTNALDAITCWCEYRSLNSFGRTISLIHIY
jgi:hypothetical protein